MKFSLANGTDFRQHTYHAGALRPQQDVQAPQAGPELSASPGRPFSESSSSLRSSHGEHSARISALSATLPSCHPTGSCPTQLLSYCP